MQNPRWRQQYYFVTLLEVLTEAQHSKKIKEAMGPGGKSIRNTLSIGSEVPVSNLSSSISESTNDLADPSTPATSVYDPTLSDDQLANLSDDFSKCPFGEKTFSGRRVDRKANLKRHLREQHCNTNETYSCLYPGCGRCYPNLRNLQRHCKQKGHDIPTLPGG